MLPLSLESLARFFWRALRLSLNIEAIQLFPNNSSFNMEKIFIGLLLASLTACGNSVSLGGKYYIDRTDFDRVSVLKKTPNGSIALIGAHVVDWKRVENYSVLLRKVTYSPDCYDKDGIPTIVTHYTDKSEFWIINVRSEIEYGPFNIEQYKLKLTQLGIPFVKLQVPSSYSQTQRISMNLQRHAKSVTKNWAAFKKRLRHYNW